MNAFRMCGDILHVLAILVLCRRLCAYKNAQGVSLKTQELYLVVFCTRYLDLFTSFYSWYNSVMKVFFLGSSVGFVWLLRKWEPTRTTYRKQEDYFQHWKNIAAPIAIVAFLCPSSGSPGSIGFDVLDLLWNFSILLESVAIVPQIMAFRRFREVENLTGGAFILMMGGYRGLYCLNWIYRSHTEIYYQHNYLVYVSGVVQVITSFAGFFWKASLDESPSAPLLPQLKEFFSTLFRLEDYLSSTLTSRLEERSNMEDPNAITSAHNGKKSPTDKSEDQHAGTLQEPLLVV